jgi:hypothetical protein
VSGAFSVLARFVLRTALSFCLIVAVLLAGHWALGEWRAFQGVARDLRVLRGGEQQLGAERARLRGEAIARVRGLRLAPAAVLDARILALGQQLDALAAFPANPLLAFPLPDGSALAQALVARSGRMLQVELLTQERQYLVALRAGLDRSAAAHNLALLHAAHVRAYDALNDNLRAQSRIRVDSFLRSHIFGTLEYRRRDQLVRAEAALVQANNDAARAVLAQQRAMQIVGAPAAGLAFIVNEARLDDAMGQLRGAIAGASTYAASNLAGRMLSALREVTPAALWILLSLTLLPLAIKLLFYYVLAPLAERLPPFYVDRGAGGALALQDAGGRRAGATGNSSAPSAQLLLSPADQLLIQPACIQSAPVTVAARTRWLLDWANPFSCLAAGLFAMTRVTSSEPATIVVSPAGDPLAEIAILTLPAGSAMVFQPRALVGVVVGRGQPVRMARYWRLFSLHAWLTLQLRYLVLRGPVTLVVKGCRGVRVDGAGEGRVISQAATLGFGAGTAYSTSRCPTFLPYLTGRAPLLNDRFDGADGFCVYEEALPAGAGKGVVGRGLEGLADAVLKVFGL